ncbi:MAG: YraN family protein [Melioribacteraceae bacterium]|nr:YraN family protein [Melioribacteraceae bacterium]
MEKVNGTFKTEKGSYGEELAVKFIKEKGYEIIEQNYRYGHGEVDIVAKDKDTLVFIEVKFRKNLEFGPPELAVTKSKQKQVRKISELFIMDKGEKVEFKDARIDVIAILKFPNEDPQINHIINAF